MIPPPKEANEVAARKGFALHKQLLDVATRADEAFRKHVQQEAAQELIERKSHQLLCVL
jgi:hypothetical protein